MLGWVSWRAKVVLLIGLLLWVPSAAQAQGAPELRPIVDPDSGLHADVGRAATALHGSSRLQPARAAEFLSVTETQRSEPSFWRHLLVGTGVGVAIGFVHGWSVDGNQSRVDSADSFWNFESDYYYRIMHSSIGAGIGGAAGTTVYLIRR